MYDVIVIGAGIAGSYLAGKLACQGLSVCVLEKNARAGHKSSCTGIISKDCFELLSLDLRMVQWQARSAKIFSPSGKYIRVERETTQAYILDRPALDFQIAEQAQKTALNFTSPHLCREFVQTLIWLTFKRPPTAGQSA